MADEIAELVARFRLEPHPEGGFYRETYRSDSNVHDMLTGEVRPASTAILFLLTPGSFSAFHRLRFDEVWHYYAGDPITLHLLAEDREHEALEVGPGTPQAIVPLGVWQAALCNGERFSLCGCTVAPGFEFADFEPGSREELARAFPTRRALIDVFTRG